jgi:predicted butyrate kinase (DUF1464 family)
MAHAEKSVRVAGTDPGTTSLDVLVLDDGRVVDQCRFGPEQLQADASGPVRWLEDRGPFDLVAGPSGYGLPLVRSADCTDRDVALMTLLRRDDAGRGGVVAGFRAVVEAMRASALPVIFLPGVIHLATVPAYRKTNRIDLGTADKLCVAALALERRPDLAAGGCCVVELGTAFTACLVLSEGRVIDGLGGSCGPPGWRSPGGWDGELAYLLSPLAKRDLFAGGVVVHPDGTAASALYREGLVKAVAGLQAVTPFAHVLLAGRLLEREPEFTAPIATDLARFGTVARLESLPGAWVKHAAQGAALLADGLAGGRHAALVERLALRGAAGTVLDWLCHPREAEIWAALR